MSATGNTQYRSQHFLTEEEMFQPCSLFSSEVQEQSDIDLLTDKAGLLHIAATSLLSASTNHYVPRENCSRAIQAAQNPFSKPTADLTHLSSPSKIVSSKMETAPSSEILKPIRDFFQPIATVSQELLTGNDIRKKEIQHQIDETAMSIAFGFLGVAKTPKFQLASKIKLPAIDKIKFDPNTFVRAKTEHLKNSTVEYCKIKGDKDSILFYLEWIGNPRGKSGAFFETMGRFHKIAEKEGAKRVFVQMDPVNDHLLEVFKKKYTFQGTHPFYLTEEIMFMEGGMKNLYPVFEISKPI